MTDLEIIQRLGLCYPGLPDQSYEEIVREAKGDKELALRLCRGAFLEMACWDGESEPSPGEGDDLYAV
jgi:hypothetical protein